MLSLSTAYKLTPSVLVADVWEAPHIAQVHCVADDRQEEIHLLAPCLSGWIQTGLLDHKRPESPRSICPVPYSPGAFPRALSRCTGVPVWHLCGPWDWFLLFLSNATIHQPAILFRFVLLVLVLSVHHHCLFHLHGQGWDAVSASAESFLALADMAPMRRLRRRRRKDQLADQNGEITAMDLII